jgi:hypothetical protein
MLILMPGSKIWKKIKEEMRDLLAERCALNESPSNLYLHNERNCQFFLSYEGPGVVTSLTQYGNESSVTTHYNGKETKEEGKEDEILIIEEAADNLEGCFGDNCYPLALEWGLPQEPLLNSMYCSFCLKTYCVFLQYQDELERVAEIM